MKTTLENKNLPEILSLRQREAEVLTSIVKSGNKYSRQAVDKLAQLFAPELKKWSKDMMMQNSGRSYGLSIRDYVSAALQGLHKTATDYTPEINPITKRKSACKTWLYVNVYSSCNDLAKKNERKMEVEVSEGKLPEKKSSKKSKKVPNKELEEPKIVSLDDLLKDENTAPQSQYTGPWKKYRASNQIVKRLKAIISEKAASSGPCQKKAQRVQEFIKHVEADGNKVSFAEKTGCSRTTLDSNINFLLEKDPELKEMAKQVTRFWSKDSKRTKK